MDEAVSGAGSVLARHEALLASGHLRRDTAQAALARRLDDLVAALVDFQTHRNAGTLGRLIGRRREPPRGLYIFGAVGRGKTFLMDLFFEAAPVRRKRRVHFHAFMEDVHGRIHDWRTRKGTGVVSGDDPIAPVAAALVEDAWLLCLDEFAVNDIADAMILGRLFKAMFERGAVVLATSNIAPADLYRDGLNRSLFVPFIALIGERMEVFRLDAGADFRLEKLGNAPVWFTPADCAASAALDRAFLALTGRPRGVPESLEFHGRALLVPRAWGGVARFAYDALCRAPLGSADFLALARRFHTLLVDGFAIIPAEARDEARRVVNLIDTLYDLKVKLIASAQGEPEALFAAPEGVTPEFARTISRLHEMRSRDYLGLAHGGAARLPGDVGGLVET